MVLQPYLTVLQTIIPVFYIKSYLDIHYFFKFYRYSVYPVNHCEVYLMSANSDVKHLEKLFKNKTWKILKSIQRKVTCVHNLELTTVNFLGLFLHF